MLTTDGDRRVPRVSALVKRIIPWRPSTVTCDRFRLAEFQDATRGRVAVRPRVQRWSEASEDIRALRSLALDGPLAIATEARGLLSASLAASCVQSDTGGSLRLVKRSTNNTGRDDAAVSLALRATGTVGSASPDPVVGRRRQRPGARGGLPRVPSSPSPSHAGPRPPGVVAVFTRGIFSMLKSLEKALRLSEIRERLNTINAMTDADVTEAIKAEEQTLITELNTCEVEYREALQAEDDARTTPTVDDAAEREYREILGRGNVGRIMAAFVEHRSTDGAEAEVQQHRGLNANQIPLDMLRAPVEHRAVTTGPTNVGTTEEPAIMPIFARGVGAVPVD